jgi:hypothetical protein
MLVSLQFPFFAFLALELWYRRAHIFAMPNLASQGKSHE